MEVVPTAKVVIEKFVFDVLGGMVTVAGTVASDVSALPSVTTVPEGPDRPLR